MQRNIILNVSESKIQNPDELKPEKSKHNTHKSNSKEKENKFQTPLNPKNDISYSNLQVPESIQLSDGKRVHIKLSQNHNDIPSFGLSDIKSNHPQTYTDYGRIIFNSSDDSDDDDIDMNDDISTKMRYSPVEKYENITLKNYIKKNSLIPLKFIKRHYKKFKALGNILLKKNKEEKIQDFIKLEEEKESKEATPEPESMKPSKLNKVKSFMQYNLVENVFTQEPYHEKSPIHRFLPYYKKNEEKYKKNLLIYIREHNNANKPKSVNCKYAEYISNNSNEKPSDSDKIYFCDVKRKKVISTRKTFAFDKDIYQYKLTNGVNIISKKDPLKFKFFFDDDIGFDSHWQAPLIESRADDDIETDDEIMHLARDRCLDDLNDGLYDWNKNKHMCRNYRLAKKIKKISEKSS